MLAARLVQAESAVSPICELPARFRSGFVWVNVTVPQTPEPLSFLLDSGASTSVLNLTVARRLGLELGRKVSVTGVSATLSGNWPAKLSAKLGPVQLPDEYLVLELDKLSRACERSVDGLIGADFFRGRLIQIDYSAEKARIFDELPHGVDVTAVPLDIRSCGLRVAVNVNGGKAQWVRVDTGCATAFQWVSSNIPAGRCATKPSVGLAELSIPQTLTGVRIGNHFLDMVPTGLHRKAIFPGESGLLGNGFFARFGVITIDAKAGRLFLGQ